jgi:DNA invertase Pin-like site-specific DNA recombinase
MSPRKLIPAAEYVRMSKLTQRYSLSNQKDAIRDYAIKNGFRIVRTYVDAGKTGVNLGRRPGLTSLLRDVKSGRVGFKAILTYDVSRWGRFQDTDEPGSYEFQCKRAGVQVHYCAEEFSNAGGMTSSIIKILKRMMAAEYSRELSAKVYAGQRRLARLGFHMGGPSPYGLRRLSLSLSGKSTRKYIRGEHKGSQDRHVILVPGPKSEASCVRRIFSLASRDRKTPRQIACQLNGVGIQHRNRPWTKWSIFKILTNPVYAGCSTWGRTTQRIQGHQRSLPPSSWILTAGSYVPIVDRETFQRVHAMIMTRRTPRKSDRELLDKLRSLLLINGRLSTQIMNKTRGVPCATTYASHFGSLLEAYQRVAYSTSVRVQKIIRSRLLTQKLRKQLLEHVQYLFPDDLRIKRRTGIKNEIIEIDGKIDVSLFLCRKEKLPDKNRRWCCQIRPGERGNLALIALVDPGFRRIRAFHLLPPFGNSIEMFRFFREDDSRFAIGEKLADLSDLCETARRIDGRSRRQSKCAPTSSSGKRGSASFEAKEDSLETSPPDTESSPEALVQVAQYVRMSTDLQENSTKSQKEIMAKFAERNGMRIVRTYEDLGRSGLLLQYRSGLKNLLHDVLTGHAPFKAILVFDVSRWGRFQDPDEAAHYEFLCRNCGVPIYYCGELFSNDSTLENSALKALKRAMAAEFSRDLSNKVAEAAKKCVEHGYRVGGVPGFGYRRLEVTRDGTPQHRLALGERKYVHSDHVVLEPGPKTEVEIVRRIFGEVVNQRKGYAEIARGLNREGLMRDGVPWEHEAIRRLLANPKYAGKNVWNRSSGRLGTKRVRIPENQWVVKPDAFPPLVTPKFFDLAQIRKRTWTDRLWPDEKIITSLKGLLRVKGKLTERLLKNTPGMPNQDNLRKRFGACRNTWRMAGYELPARYMKSGSKFASGQQLRNEILARIANKFPGRVATTHLSGQLRKLLKVDDEILVSILFCRRERTRYGKLRWVVEPIPRERPYITLVCLLNRASNKVFRFYLFPKIDLLACHRVQASDKWLQEAVCLRDLSKFCEIVRTMRENIDLNRTG